MGNIIYRTNTPILRENGKPLEFGDEVLIMLNQDANPVLPVSVKGIFQPPFDQTTSPLVYTFEYDESQAGTLVECHILSVRHFGCCEKQAERLTNLINFLGITENADGTFTQ